MSFGKTSRHLATAALALCCSLSFASSSFSLPGESGKQIFGIVAEAALSAPKGVSIKDTLDGENSIVTISWNKVSGAAGYRVLYREKGSEKIQEFALTTGQAVSNKPNTSSVIRTPVLKSQTTYIFYVKSYYYNVSSRKLVYSNATTVTYTTSHKKNQLKNMKATITGPKYKAVVSASGKSGQVQPAMLSETVPETGGAGGGTASTVNEVTNAVITDALSSPAGNGTRQSGQTAGDAVAVFEAAGAEDPAGASDTAGAVDPVGASDAAGAANPAGAADASGTSTTDPEAGNTGAGDPAGQQGGADSTGAGDSQGSEAGSSAGTGTGSEPGSGSSISDGSGSGDGTGNNQGSGTENGTGNTAGNDTVEAGESEDTALPKAIYQFKLKWKAVKNISVKSCVLYDADTEKKVSSSVYSFKSTKAGAKSTSFKLKFKAKKGHYNVPETIRCVVKDSLGDRYEVWIEDVPQPKES